MARGAAVAATLATARGPLPARGVAATAAVDLPRRRRVGRGRHDRLRRTRRRPPLGAGPLGRVDEGTIVPGFVDCHVHLPFVGWRADEFEARLAGVSYRDIHGNEGGIFRSARMLAEADDEEVLSFSRALAVEMAAHGTTAMELKTGYGLSVEGELRQLRLARRLAEMVPQTCAVTLLACHAIPDGIVTGGLGRGRVRRADPRGRGGGARGRRRHLRRGHRVLPRGPRAGGGGGLGRGAAAAGARRPARAERSGRGRRRAGRAERRPPEPHRPRGRRGAGRGADRRGAAAGLDLHAPGGAGARRCAPGRRRRPRDRDRPESGNLTRLLDARDDRDGVLDLRTDPARSAHRRDGEPGVGARARSTVAAPSSRASAPTSWCWTDRPSPTCRTGRVTTPSSRR